MTNLWQECRAYIATVLFGWAQGAHFGATMELARGLARMERERRAVMHRAEEGDGPSPFTVLDIGLAEQAAAYRCTCHVWIAPGAEHLVGCPVAGGEGR